MRWEVPREWEGERCYIIGGGPSVQRLRKELIESENLIVINNAYKLFPHAAFCFFFDQKWHTQHERELNRIFTGRVVTHHNKYDQHNKILYLKKGSNDGLSPNPKTINNGNNSGHGALNLAVHLGATEIYLLGYDMRVVGNHHNFHNEHQRRMKDDIYTQYIRNMKTIKLPDGIIVWNATPNSALDHFPFAHEEIERLYEPA